MTSVLIRRVESQCLEFDVDTIFVTNVVKEADSLVASPLSDSVKNEGWSSTLSWMAVKKLSLCGSENLKFLSLENKWFITLLDERACDILLADRDAQSSDVRNSSMSCVIMPVRLRLIKSLWICN